MIVVVFVVTIVVFILLHLLPGGPARAALGPTATPLQIRTFNHQMGYDRSLPVQYGEWLWRLLHLNFGHSYVLNENVAPLIAQRLPRTLVLSSLALLVAWAIGLPLGLYQGVHQGSRRDHIFTYVTFLAWGIPQFFLGIILVLWFAARLHWLPPEGPQAYSVPGILADPRALLLPVITLAVAPLVASTRWMRQMTMDTLVQDYVRTARAKGASESVVLFRHVLRNSLLPFATFAGFALPIVLGGSAIIEEIFNYPGMGLLFLQSAQQYDFPVLLAIVLILAIAVVVGNFVADLLYAVIDPRIRYSSP